MKDRLRRGLARFAIKLSEEILEEEIDYLDELLRWNERINLTSIRNREEALEKHLVDSLYLLKMVKSEEHILDIGSGGGLPGIPLAIADRGMQIVSVDSVGKKINFQKHVKRRLNLDNLKVEHTRIENLAGRGCTEKSFDVIVSRAFSSLETILEQSVAWLAEGGRIIAMKGAEGRGEVDAMRDDLMGFGLKNLQIDSYRLPFSEARRCLVIIS